MFGRRQRIAWRSWPSHHAVDFSTHQIIHQLLFHCLANQLPGNRNCSCLLWEHGTITDFIWAGLPLSLLLEIYESMSIHRSFSDYFQAALSKAGPQLELEHVGQAALLVPRHSSVCHSWVHGNHVLALLLTVPLKYILSLCSAWMGSKPFTFFCGQGQSPAEPNITHNFSPRCVICWLEFGVGS